MFGLGTIALASLAGTVATLGAAFIGRHHAPRVFQFSVALMLTWLLCRVAHTLVGPSFRQILPFIDFGLICLLLRYLVETTGDINVIRAPWWISLALAPLLITLFLHTVYNPELPLEARWPYLFALNLLYAPQLFAVWVGLIAGEPLATREAERAGPSPNPAGIETERT